MASYPILNHLFSVKENIFNSVKNMWSKTGQDKRIAILAAIIFGISIIYYCYGRCFKAKTKKECIEDKSLVLIKKEDKKPLPSPPKQIDVEEPEDKKEDTPDIKKEFDLGVIISLFTKKTSEEEKTAALEQIPIKDLQNYIEELSYFHDKQKFYLLPLAVLSQLDPATLKEESIYYLCFGKSKEQIMRSIPVDLLDGRARFEALIGLNEDLLMKFADDKIFAPYFSVKQLARLHSKFAGDAFIAKFCKSDLSHFFPRYHFPSQELLKEEKNRFNALFSEEHLQYMLEEGSLHFPSDLAADSSKQIECRNIKYRWDYYIGLISNERLQMIEFSLTDDKKRFRISPIQLCFMFTTYGSKPLLQADLLSLKQKDDIKYALNFIYTVATSSTKNTEKVLNFLNDYWNEYLLTLVNFFPEEEWGKMAKDLRGMA